MASPFPTVNNGVLTTQAGGETIIEKISYTYVSSIAIQESPFSYKQQTQDFGGRKYEALVTIKPLNHTDAGTFEGFLQSLAGTGTFYLTNPLGGTQREYRLATNNYRYDIEKNGLYSFSLACVEVV